MKKKNKLTKLAEKFQPWDFGFNLEIEREMLNGMYKFFSSNKPTTMGSERAAREIKLAIKLLEIIMEEDSAVSWTEIGPIHGWKLNKYVNVRNASRFWNFLELEEPTIRDYLRQMKAWYLYNKLRLYRMRTWWDQVNKMI